MRSTTRLFAALLMFPVLPACIAVPVGHAGEEPFSDEKLAFIEVGKSTKEDIAAAMPEPLQFLDGNTWLYAGARKEAQWWVAQGVLGGGGETTLGSFDLRYLMIRFDDEGVVAGYEKSSSEGAFGCNRYGVCFLPGPTFMLVAPEEDDRAVKQLDQAQDQCGVYLYGGRSNIVTISLDDRQIGGLFDNKHFLFNKVEPGSHKLDSDNLGHVPVEFTCVAGSSVFFEFMDKRCGFLDDCGRNQLEVAQSDVTEGRQAIAERDWIVTVIE